LGIGQNNIIEQNALNCQLKLQIHAIANNQYNCKQTHLPNFGVFVKVPFETRTGTEAFIEKSSHKF
jgi:hypothetical protein